MQRGQVVKLDRGYPLVLIEDGRLLRCEHAIALVKGVDARAVIGDCVEVEVSENHDKGIIASILPRTRALIRKDPTERAQAQVLAANFDQVIVAQPVTDVNIRRLERELVLAHETGAKVVVVLTKADLAESSEKAEEVCLQVEALVGKQVPTLVVSEYNPESLEAVQKLLAPDTITILLGKSGVGKSSLINMLVGHQLQETTPIRDDGKGRHTTVSREMVKLPNGSHVVDMPGVRGLGLWESETGIGTAFGDVEELAAQCRFRDCRHGDEPGCAVREAVKQGLLSAERYKSYVALKEETSTLRQRREEARRMKGEKASDKRVGKKSAASVFRSKSGAKSHSRRKH